MSKTRSSLAVRIAAVAFLGFAGAAVAQEPPMVGGAPMLPTMTIPENASKADNLTTLVAAVTAAGLVDTLASDGPFTVFAPTNDAFAKLPAGTVDNLVKPEMKDTLTGILTYHVVAGNYTANALAAAIDAGGGKAELKTVAGGTLTAMMKDGGIALMDAAGNTAMVTQANVTQKNGVVHVIDTVLMPKA
ncbi:fasciclin domain-containing protein [Chthonobacter rhizosphaerae]|uniref:fasciclin domain-containing protein n=1 Tax=Chthonobacter rhizosphaerae TaxID=2735553 RepID=UPI0015EFD2B3|nr:fasciclin domain-containing protein [Chthonobacter rhizosphaerae]